MLILLPPSETKRAGGAGSPLALDRLRFPALHPVRQEVVDALLELSADRDASVKALKLGPKQAGEVERNRSVRTAPTMRALERYTGVLYDALGAESLTDNEWQAAAEAVAVQSALFGLVGAADLIPAYRLSFDSRLSTRRGAASLKKRWAAAGAAALAERDDLVLDLRSEGYTALAPLPDRAGVHYVRVLARGDDGQVRALNHFNKQAKGLLTRAIIEAGASFGSTDDLLEWAEGEDYDLRPAGDGSRDLLLVVPEVRGVPGRLMAALRA